MTGARHVTWLWQVNSVWPTSEPLSLLWPGNSYVNEVGIDGQLNKSAASFTSVFSQTVAQVRAITGRPVMISEAAVSQGPQRPAQITGLFSGARRDGLYALILFDVHPRWQIDSDPAALDGFRKAAKEVG
jgi:mannan endo-1,4-beta-mannosidase